MDFDREYRILTSLSTQQILQIKFIFQGVSIRVLYRNDNVHYLLYIYDFENTTYVRNILLYPKDERFQINQYMGDYHAYSLPLRNQDYDPVENPKLPYSDFFQKLSSVILNLHSPASDTIIESIDVPTSTKIITDTTCKSPKQLNGKKRYFDTIVRKRISPTHFNVVKEILGIEYALYLRKNSITARFTTDINEQKKFILIPD